MRRRQQHHREDKDKFCYFCVHNMIDIDYKDADTIKKFTSNYAKILPAKRMGACAKHQRKLAQAVKRARFMALLPYTNR